MCTHPTRLRRGSVSARACSLREWSVSSVGAPSGVLTENHLRARQSALGLDPHAPLPAIPEQAEVAVALEIQQFEEVPSKLLDFEPWDVLHVGKLARPEHITRSEGRGLLWAVAHAHRTSSHHPRRMLFLKSLLTTCHCALLSLGTDPVLVTFFTLSEL